MSRPSEQESLSEQAPRSPRGRGTRLLAVGGFAATGLALAFVGAAELSGIEAAKELKAQKASAAKARKQVLQLAAVSVDDKAQIIVSGADAQSRNDALPLANLPLEHVSGVKLASLASGSAKSTALKCLTQAIYYEAANEPVGGRRAVAQVVLNRMRHPAYPSSVCGVVYQGAERRTGCQFSFTCDGSLLRKPAAGLWREAEKLARDALAGHVEKSVGTATHYHADYVLPKWAFNLGKIGKLGRHIFYRFNGSWGRAGAFHERYSGRENIPALNYDALRARADESGFLIASEQFVPGLTVTPHVTDRHAATDVGGRLDTTKEWRLSIPDPVEASSRYREAVADTAPSSKPESHIALATQEPAAITQ